MYVPNFQLDILHRPINVSSPVAHSLHQKQMMHVGVSNLFNIIVICEQNNLHA